MSDRAGLRLWGGKVVQAHVLRRFLFMRLVAWEVSESWDGTPPFNEYTKTKWRPSWRLF